MKSFIYILVSFTLLGSVSALAKEGRTEVVTGRYVTGGVIGSVIGFGIGHAIQGRYGSDRGWIFTTGEAAGFTLAIAGIGRQSCTDTTSYNYNSNCDRSSANSLIAVGFLTMLGFHVWEVVDLWAGATPVDSQTEAFIIPNTDAPGVGLSYRF